MDLKHDFEISTQRTRSKALVSQKKKEKNTSLTS